MESKILSNEMAKGEFTRLVSELIEIGYSQNDILDELNIHMKQMIKEQLEMQ